MTKRRGPEDMVKTRERNDCGVCAVANRCNITWEAARHRLFGMGYRRSFNTTTRMMLDAMFINGWRLIRIKRDWYDVPNNSVVKVIPSGMRKGDWHWVVWRDGLVWDSCHELPVTPDRYSHPPVSYIGYRE